MVERKLFSRFSAEHSEIELFWFRNLSLNRKGAIISDKLNIQKHKKWNLPIPKDFGDFSKSGLDSLVSFRFLMSDGGGATRRPCFAFFPFGILF